MRLLHLYFTPPHIVPLVTAKVRLKTLLLPPHAQTGPNISLHIQHTHKHAPPHTYIHTHTYVYTHIPIHIHTYTWSIQRSFPLWTLKINQSYLRIDLCVINTGNMKCYAQNKYMVNHFATGNTYFEHTKHITIHVVQKHVFKIFWSNCSL